MTFLGNFINVNTMQHLNLYQQGQKDKAYITSKIINQGFITSSKLPLTNLLIKIQKSPIKQLRPPQLIRTDRNTSYNQKSKTNYDRCEQTTNYLGQIFFTQIYTGKKRLQ